MKRLPKQFQFADVVPNEFSGKWLLLSGPSGIPYLQILTSGKYYTSFGQHEFTVATNGAKLTLENVVYDRFYGNGQTIIGVWRTDVNGDTVEQYFRSDSTFTYNDQFGAIFGLYDLTQTSANGEVFQWQNRAEIVGFLSTGNVSEPTEHLVTANAAFGGTFSFLMRKQQDNLVIESSDGKINKYQPIL